MKTLVTARSVVSVTPIVGDNPEGAKVRHFTKGVFRIGETILASTAVPLGGKWDARSMVRELGKAPARFRIMNQTAFDAALALGLLR
jgi:hypothetical protein